MKNHRKVVLALFVCTTIAAEGQSARAQTRSASRVAQNTSPSMSRVVATQMPAGQATTAPSMVPAGAGAYEGSSPSPDSYYSGMSSEPGGFGDGCCDGYSGYSCGESCDSGGWHPGMSCFGGNSCRWYITADYLNVRAHFSDALAYVTEVDTNDPQATTRTYHQLEFDYESSFRVGGGYRLGCCGEELVFNFTRFTSSADATVDGGGRFTGTRVELPFNVNPTNPAPPATSDPFLGTTQTGRIRASVDVNTYDLEFRKTIPLGGTSCSECGDVCGCGDPCRPRCPAWDITWSGGIRGATVDWDRNYFLVDSQVTDNNTQTRSELQFDGAGPRFGVEGRRYFGRNGWFSVFLKGDISLLLGELDLSTIQHVAVNGQDNFERELLHAQQIIPVTDIEAGLSASVTCHSTFSAGYMLSAWHDLGFRDEAVLGVQQLDQSLITHYDDGNIMSFDGFFARVEWVY